MNFQLLKKNFGFLIILKQAEASPSRDRILTFTGNLISGVMLPNPPVFRKRNKTSFLFFETLDFTEKLFFGWVSSLKLVDVYQAKKE
jgi:hypothetical protein